jgi:hypothetical protein
MKAGRILRVTLAALLASGIMGAMPNTAKALSTTTDLGIESLSGWSTARENTESDVWRVLDATDAAQANLPSPHSGGSYAVLSSNEPGARVMYRDIVLPANQRTTLSYQYFVASLEPFNSNGTMSAAGMGGNQQFRVDLVYPDFAAAGNWFGSTYDGLIRNLSAPAEITGEPSWITVSIDLTPWAGQTVALAFREVDNAGPFTVGVDSVSLESQDLWVDAPVATVKPVVTGDFAAVGVPLTGTRGSWTSISAYFRPQWYRCTKAGAAVDQYTPVAAPSGCSAISGATELTYTPVTADKGKFLRMRSGGTGDGGQLFSFSKATAVIGTAPVSTASVPPTVGGVVKVGRTLTAAKGTWTGTPTPTYAYQWYRCTATGVAAATVPDTCTVIAGATKSTYKLLTADKTAGYIRVKVTATSTAGVTVRVSAAKKIL